MVNFTSLTDSGARLLKSLAISAVLMFQTYAYAGIPVDNLAAQSPAAQPVVILVPGFFNSFAPEYFSSDIVSSFQRYGFKVYIAKKLNPIGTIQDNGERVLQLFEAIKNENPKSDIHVVGHSAGGLYSLYAINKKAHYIKSLSTVSTPFDGVEFVENWTENFHALKKLLDFCYLEGLKQLTKPFVQKFVASLRIPTSLRITSYAGYQPVTLDFFDAANMSSILSIPAAFINGPSDGIVSFRSATTAVKLFTQAKTQISVQINRQYLIGLEHWEQVLDYRSFVLLGSHNIDLIKNRQINFYSQIAAKIKTNK